MIVKFCPQCAGFLRDYPENCMKREFKKCGTCGFTRRIIMYKEIITLKAYFMGRDDAYASEFTEEIKKNAAKLLQQVNQLLTELNILTATVTSGWRPKAINEGLGNSAKKSLHLQGLAVDLLDDKDQTLGKLLASKSDLLKKYDLWMEDLESTKNWVHLYIGTRSDRPIRTFKP